MPKKILAAIFIAALATLLCPVPELGASTASAQEGPRCARPSSVQCNSPDFAACAGEGVCLDRGGELTQGCLHYVCKKNLSREEQLREELRAAEEARRRAEEERLREEERRRAEQTQGGANVPIPSGGAGASAPCGSGGGGADDCAGSQGSSEPIDLGVKTLPKGGTGIFTKPADPTGGCGPGMRRGADGQCYPDLR